MNFRSPNNPKTLKCDVCQQMTIHVQTHQDYMLKTMLNEAAAVEGGPPYQSPQQQQFSNANWQPAELHDEAANNPTAAAADNGNNDNNNAAAAPAAESKPRGAENRKLKEYIKQLEDQLQAKETELDESKKEFAKELRKKEATIESYQKEHNEYVRAMEKAQNFKKKYDATLQENCSLKEELLAAMKENQELVKKLVECTDPEKKRQELMKNFQDEYKLLQDCINDEWEQKTEELK